MMTLRTRPDLCEMDSNNRLIPAFKDNYMNCPSWKKMMSLAGQVASHSVKGQTK